MPKQYRDEDEDFEAPRKGGKGKKRQAEEIDLDDVLDGFDEAEASGRLPKMRDGHYSHLRVDNILFKPGYYGTAFVMEFTLAGSHSEGEHGAGQRLSQTINGFDDRNRKTLAQGNLKNFAAAVFPKLPKEKLLAAVKAAVKDPGATVEGLYVDADVEVRNAGEKNEFVLANFSVSKGEPEARESRRQPPPVTRRPRDEEESDESDED